MRDSVLKRWMRHGLVLSAGLALAVGCGKDGTGPAAEYTLSLTPAALTIVQGATGSATVTITRTNFNGAVPLSLSGAPTGVTGSFDPAAPMGTTSTLTVSVGAAVAPGVYNLTVAGAGSAGNRSTPLTLTVNAAPDYTLSLAPTALAIAQGATGNTTVTITRTNFTGAVTLSLGGAPAGVTGSFDPAVPTGTSSTLTLSVGAAVAPGVYNLTVDGAGSAGNRSTPLTLTVNAAPDYTLSLTPAALTIVQGATGTSAVTITRTNFTGAVTLSLGNAPTGVTGSFDPAAPTGTTSTLTVSVGAAVAPGVYDVTVNGTGTAGNRATPFTLTVSAAPSYSLSLAPAALTIVQGATGTSAVTITRTNFTGAVTLTVGNAPTGVTGSFDPAAPTGTSSALTVSVGAAVAPGVYNLTVDGTGTAGNRSTPLTLTVSAAPDYTLSLAPAALTIVKGGTGTSAVTITRTNFTGAVTLSLGNAPAGVTGSFDPAAPTGTSSALTVSVGAAVAPGVYNLTVDGTGTPGNRSTPLTLTVSAPVSAVVASVSAGIDHTCGVTSRGAAYCWGYNVYGGLGNGTTTGSLIPVAVSGGLTFAMVSTGNDYTCGVTTSGAAYCWGLRGQLGDGTSGTDRLTPVAVSGGLTFVAVSARGFHTCGVTTSGAAYCWGTNGSGELGNGTRTGSLIPVAVSGGLTFATVTAGDYETCGVTTSGAAYCWGLNSFGASGDGTGTFSTTPVAVSGGHTFAAVSAGFYFTCGVTTSGAAYCWGYNGGGTLGNGTTTNSLIPVAVSGGLTFAAVSIGGSGSTIAPHTCGVTPGGTAYCWGYNGYGQLGDGTSGTNRLTPVAVSGGLTFGP